MTLFQRGLVTLVWPEEHQLYGLEIVMRRRSFGSIIEAWRTDDSVAIPRADQPLKVQADAVQDDAEAFAALIVRWNLADEQGEPVPVSGDALLATCDVDMLNDMRLAYEQATARVSPPLPVSSVDGPEDWTPSLPAQEILTATEASPVGSDV